MQRWPWIAALVVALGACRVTCGPVKDPGNMPARFGDDDDPKARQQQQWEQAVQQTSGGNGGTTRANVPGAVGAGAAVVGLGVGAIVAAPSDAGPPPAAPRDTRAAPR